MAKKQMDITIRCFRLDGSPVDIKKPDRATRMILTGLTLDAIRQMGFAPVEADWEHKLSLAAK